MDEEKKELSREKIKELTKNDIKIYIPKDKNINYMGERVLQLGAFVYGIMIPASTKKVKITYNINPENIHPDHFDECETKDVPEKIFEMLMKKVNADISRLDSMMTNIVKNKGFLNHFFVYAEENKSNGNKDLADVGEYTEEDAQKDKIAEQKKMMEMQRQQASLMKRPDSVKKIKARRAKAKAKKR